LGHTKFPIGSHLIRHTVSKHKHNPHKGQQQSGNVHRCGVHLTYKHWRVCKFDDDSGAFFAPSEPRARQEKGPARSLAGDHPCFRSLRSYFPHNNKRGEHGPGSRGECQAAQRTNPHAECSEPAQIRAGPDRPGTPPQGDPLFQRASRTTIASNSTIDSATFTRLMHCVAGSKRHRASATSLGATAAGVDVHQCRSPAQFAQGQQLLKDR
jgi:hypothetical protein